MEEPDESTATLNTGENYQDHRRRDHLQSKDSIKFTVEHGYSIILSIPYIKFSKMLVDSAIEQD